jgi:hypothetical protein
LKDQNCINAKFKPRYFHISKSPRVNPLFAESMSLPQTQRRVIFFLSPSTIYKQNEKRKEKGNLLYGVVLSSPICDLDHKINSDRAVAGPQGLSRRKHSSSSTTPTRIVYSESSKALDLPFWQTNWFISLLFAMALGFFTLAIYLFLFLGGDESFGFGSPSPASAASSEKAVQVTYGSILKLMHEKTKYRLHSHDVPYGSGSGQQSVTGYPEVDDANSYWIVRPTLDSSEKQGDPINTGALIRLQHMKTRKWLHSHLHASPISGNLEVSCFGGEEESDTGDYWRVMIERSGTTWKQDKKIRLQHVDTGGYLHSHNKKYQRIAGGQQEVCGIREKQQNNIWLAAEGVYLPVTESK